jgi:hypothetical protein
MAAGGANGIERRAIARRAVVALSEELDEPGQHTPVAAD